MDELDPKPHHRRRRSRRLRLTGLILSLASLLIYAAGQAAPGSIIPPLPSPITQILDITKQTADNAASDAKDTVLEAQPGLWRVTRAVDGDTLNVELNGQKETVRLLGLDTPETHDPRKPVQCFGEAAAAHTKALVEGKNVRLEPDPTDSDRDKYHRLLRYVYLPDGTLINAALIRNGYAFAYTIFPLTKLDEFRALEANARSHNRGLWAGCNVDESKDIKQTTSKK